AMRPSQPSSRPLLHDIRGRAPRSSLAGAWKFLLLTLIGSGWGCGGGEPSTNGGPASDVGSAPATAPLSTPGPRETAKATPTSPKSRPSAPEPNPTVPVGELKRFDGYTEAVGSVSFSPSGTQAISAPGGSSFVAYGDDHDYGMRLFDVGSGKDVRRFKGHTGF